MSKFQDLSGQSFGSLTVIKRIDDHISSGGNHFVNYLCQCSCGKYTTVTAGKLKTGHKKSCGYCGIYNNFRDLSGMKFDKLTVVGTSGFYTYPNGEKDYKWHCLCECGNDVIIRGNSLKTSGHHSCSDCQRKIIKISDEEMINRRFGKLIVVRRAEPKYTKSGTIISRWYCQCDCGNITTVTGAQLRNGHTHSCGCYRLDMLSDSLYISKSENIVKNYLEDNAIPYVSQKCFPDLVGSHGGLLSYDFEIFSLSHGLILIECQGSQHFSPVDFFGGQTAFTKQLKHDAMKRSYAKLIGASLLEIDCRPYNINNIESILDKYL